MALVGISIPSEMARVLGEINVPGRREPRDHLHITLMVFEDSPIDVMADAMVVVHQVAATTRPFTASTSLVTTFPRGDDGVPVIAKVDSPGLMSLRDRLAKALDAEGIEFSKRFPVYKPHVTLAYSQDDMVDQPIPLVEWNINEIVLWTGEYGAPGTTVVFPLSLNAVPPLEEKVASRFLGSQFEAYGVKS